MEHDHRAAQLKSSVSCLHVQNDIDWSPPVCGFQKKHGTSPENTGDLKQNQNNILNKYQSGQDIFQGTENTSKHSKVHH